jgi:hypothetical protein
MQFGQVECAIVVVVDPVALGVLVNIGSGQKMPALNGSSPTIPPTLRPIVCYADIALESGSNYSRERCHMYDRWLT